MTRDPYAVLGLSRFCEDAVIRAAYLALMRAYHPDRNKSDAAAARAREVVAAYAVLGDPEKRAEYDSTLFEIRAPEPPAERVSLWQKLGPAAWAGARPGPLLAVAALAAALLFLPPLFSGQQAPDAPLAEPPLVQEARMAAPQAQVDREELCASPATMALLKRELFRRTARRQRDGGRDLLQLADQTFIRADILAASGEGPQALRCNAAITLELGPAVALGSGQRRLKGQLAYDVRQEGGSRPRVELADAGGITAPLATLARAMPAPSPAAETPEILAAGAPDERPPIRAATPAPQIAANARQERAPQQSANSRCSYASSRGAAAVCRDAGVAALDRHLGLLFGQSVAQADARSRDALFRDQNRFVGGLENCPSDACIRSAYLNRIKELGKTRKAQQ